MEKNTSTITKKDLKLLPNLGGNAKGFAKVSAFWQTLKQNEYYYLVYAFIIPFALMYLIYLAMGIHPFGDGSVLVLDLNGQYVSFYESLRRFVYGDASLLYSFERALGGEYMGIYAYYIASPLSYIVALFPKERILEALLTIFLIKTGLCGVTMGFYLHKLQKRVNTTAIVVFSTLYALTSYAVVHQNNNMWIDALIWLPLLTYGIEQLIKNGKYKLFVVSLATTMMSNYYIGYMVCIYTAAYFFYYYFAHNENSRNNPMKEKKHFTRSFIRIAFFSALAIGVSMVIVATAYYSLQFGKNEFSNPNYELKQQFDVLDLLSKFYPSSYDTVRPEGWPFVYCGLITIILTPCYFLSKKYSMRERTASGIFIGFFLLSFIASTIDIMWHGFQRPNWLNYRYSFMLCFFLLVLAYKAFGDLRHVSKKVIFFSGAFWAVILILLQALEYENIHDIETVWFSLLCIGAYIAILVIGKKSYFKNTVTLVLAVVTCLEVYCSGLMNCVDFGDDVIYTKYSSYNNYMEEVTPIVELVKEKDPGFYRWEKTTMRKTNDNLALGIRGVSCSTSTLNASTIKLLAAMGYTSKSNWSRYLGGTPLADSIFGLKYLVSKDDLSEYYEEFCSEGDYTAYYNPYYLSLAFGVSDAIEDFIMIPEKDYDEKDPNSNPFDRMNNLITAMLGEEETIQVFVPLEATKDPEVVNGDTGYIAGHHKYTPKSESQKCSVNYTFQNPETQELFFYMPSDYQREVNLKVNGTGKGTFFGNDTYRIIPFGHMAAGEIKLNVELKNDVLYVKDGIDMIYYIDRAKFDEVMARLGETQMVVDDTSTDTHITGSIKLDEPSKATILALSYAAVWKIFVDGEIVEYEETLDSLILFTLGEGEHQLEFKYQPKSFTLGLTITIISICIFFLFVLFDKKIFALVFKDQPERLSKEDKELLETVGDVEEVSEDEKMPDNEVNAPESNPEKESDSEKK